MNTTRHCRQSGSSLIESMVAIVILSFGILGLAKFQIGMLAQTTDAQSRLVASALAEELLSMVRVDLANAACYTTVPAGSCTSSFAVSQSKAWRDKATQAIPSITSCVASMTDGNTFNVSLVWNSKAFKEPRNLKVNTDVRP